MPIVVKKNLINFGPKQVEHEFVNTKLTYADRTHFTVNDKGWNETDGFGEKEKNLVINILHDWGTGLDSTLYKDAIMHFLGGTNQILRKVKIFQNSKCIAEQTMPLCGDATIIRITSFQDEGSEFLSQLTRLMQAANLKCAQWINISRKEVKFKTLHFSVPNFSVKNTENL